MRGRLFGGLRTTLIIGFGGMLAIFLVAGMDAIRLLRHMRVQNEVLREAAIDRSQRLASIRSYVLLSDAYMGDFFRDSDEDRAKEHQTQFENAWTQLLSSLSDYSPTSLEETVLLKRLRDMLDQHWREVNHAMSSGRRTGSSFYGDEVVPLRTSVVEITTRVADVDARQRAAAEASIQDEFEAMGQRLGVVLQLAMFSALILAGGCVLYILKIERQNRLSYQEIVEGRSAFEQLSSRLVATQEEERRSISRELHDEIGQTLTAVIVDAANLANRIPPEDAVSRRYLENIRQLADSSINSIRNIALLLRPSMLDDLGLIPALEWQAREVSRRSGIKVRVVDENVPDTLSDSVRTATYRIVQEALNNVARHSSAKSATVNVRKTDGELELTVEDDGVGFDPSRAKGVGLLGMEERVKQFGGQFEVRSHRGRGTAVRAVLPVS